MIKQIILGLFIGLLSTLFMAQFDPWAHQLLGNIFFSVMADTFDCNVSGSVESFSIVAPAMHIKNLSLSSRDKEKEWSWCAATYITGFSWFYLIFGGAIDMWVVMEGLRSYSGTADGKLAILPHIRDLMKGPQLPIPLFLKSVQMHNAFGVIDNGLHNEFFWNGESKRIDHQFRSQFYVHDGSISGEQTRFVKNISGTIGLDATEKEDEVLIAIRIDGRGEMPQLGEYPTIFLTGRWFNDRGRFQINSIDRALRVYPLIVTEKKDSFYIDATIWAPLPYLNKLISDFDPKVNGNALLQIRGSLHPEGKGEGHLICEETTHPWCKSPGVLRSSFVKNGLQIDGTWNVRSGVNYGWEGSFCWDGTTYKTVGDAINIMPLQVPRYPLWTIEPNDIRLQVAYDKPNDELTGDFSCIASNKTKDSIFCVSGNGTLDKEQHIVCQALVGDYRFALDAWNYDIPRIDYVGLFDEHENQLIHCTYSKKKDQYTGLIDLALLRFLSNALMQYDVQGEGKLVFTGRLTDKYLKADVRLKDGTVRLPQTLNFMHGCTALCEIDFATKHLKLQDVHCDLHSGSLTIPQALVWLGAQGELQFMHMPLIIDHCLFTIKHDLFAMVSGSLLLEKKPMQDPKVSGSLILDRSQLKENLFSESVQKKLLHSSDMGRQIPDLSLSCDVTIETKEPIRVDTNFLQANAHVGLRIKDHILHPSISGTISVPSGSIGFPYKPLHITKGEITFLPEQPFNPLVEIVAKNTIKNHNVSLHVTGSLQDHIVMLESTPPLTEEQIVGLLIAGAHEESLQAVLPSLLMQNVTNYIFSSHKSNFFNQYIKPWMKQINVHLMPNFNEQTGRGGLRGALEITVNERWRALIEKNFTLTEDTRFELEYILSDDVTFRVIRDERCDIGAEVEMKWKF